MLWPSIGPAMRDTLGRAVLAMAIGGAGAGGSCKTKKGRTAKKPHAGRFDALREYNLAELRKMAQGGDDDDQS